MNLTSQQYIIALAQEGSFTGAARRLGVSQPGLCGWLDNLEEQLGTRLVLRSRKGITLTPAGQIYLNGSRRMLSVQQRTAAALANLGGGEVPCLRVAGTPGGGAQIFARIFGAFTGRFPAVQLQFVESYNQEALRLVQEGNVDFALCSLPDPDACPAEHIVKRSSELIVVLPDQYPLGYDASALTAGAELPGLPLRRLDDLPFMMPSEEMSYYPVLQQLFQHAGVHPKVIFQSSNTNILYQMVCNGYGAAIVPRRCFSPRIRCPPSRCGRGSIITPALSSAAERKRPPRGIIFWNCFRSEKREKSWTFTHWNICCSSPRRAACRKRPKRPI